MALPNEQRREIRRSADSARNDGAAKRHGRNDEVCEPRGTLRRMVLSAQAEAELIVILRASAKDVRRISADEFWSRQFGDQKLHDGASVFTAAFEAIIGALECAHAREQTRL